MTDYEYDEDLPYVVATEDGVMGRFPRRDLADLFAQTFTRRSDIIDTTPKPRVPEDARYITWLEDGYRHYAEASDLPGRWFDDEGNANFLLEDLPCVTADTVFTVLDVRGKP